MITFNCEQCGTNLRVADELAGKRCRCPSCGATIPVPVVARPASPVPANDIFSGLGSNSQGGNPYGSGGSGPYVPQPQQAPQYTTPYTPTSSAGGYYSPVSNYQAKDTGNPLPMVLGIISLVVTLFSCACFYGILSPVGLVMGIIGWVVAAKERAKVARGESRSNGLNEAGYILGIVSTIVSALAFVAFIVVMIFLVIVISRENRNGNFGN